MEVAPLQTVDEMIMVWTSAGAAARRPRLRSCPNNQIPDYPAYEIRAVPQDWQKIEQHWYSEMRREFDRCRPFLTIHDITAWYAIVRDRLRITDIRDAQVEHHGIGHDARKGNWVSWMFARKMWPRDQLQGTLACIDKEWTTEDAFEDVLPVNWPFGHSVLRRMIVDICNKLDTVFVNIYVVPRLAQVYDQYRSICASWSSGRYNADYSAVLVKQAIEVFFYQALGMPPFLPSSGSFKFNILQGVLCILEMRDKFRSLCGERDDEWTGSFNLHRALDEQRTAAAEPADDEEVDSRDEATADYRHLKRVLRETSASTTVEALTKMHMSFGDLLVRGIRDLDAKNSCRLDNMTTRVLEGEQKMEKKLMDLSQTVQTNSTLGTFTPGPLQIQHVIEAAFGARMTDMENKLNQMVCIWEMQFRMISEMHQVMSSDVAQAPATPRESE
ncbi:hypothetical protein GQ602_006130 [Ophiocordyceps camponoti-floridani]|uniref:Uncharacterized protein n=1 Tax=Ophiocordyceps camponoti-floridani TaxID=2030778 RepID=A0A8H4VBL7_9HYPO|nr:hypothetical protein GQ602_006130 [Ophiocordyceps camponoti-floridani]